MEILIPIGAVIAFVVLIVVDRSNKWVHMKTNDAKESKRQRDERISCSNNGLTLRTRIVKDKTKYSRKRKYNRIED